MVTSTLEESTVESPSSLPDFIIIGAMRSGTTSLLRYLGEHPQVCVAEVKEVHFFDRNFDRGVDWYRGHFERGAGQTVCGEATPNYMFNPTVPRRMWEVVPNCRLVAILRNPVDRAYSHYWQKRSYGSEPLSFEDAIEAEPERIEQGDEARAQYSYIARGRYIQQLKGFLEYFPKESLDIYLFEDLSAHPERTFRSLCRSIGVSDEILPGAVGRKVNRYVEFRSPVLRSLSKLLPHPVRRAIGKLNSKSASYPPMDEALRKQLVGLFREDNAALAEWADLDLSSWRH